MAGAPPGVVREGGIALRRAPVCRHRHRHQRLGGPHLPCGCQCVCWGHQCAAAAALRNYGGP
eukprot:163356-Pyramimonas_sp.AAC.1